MANIPVNVNDRLIIVTATSNGQTDFDFDFLAFTIDQLAAQHISNNSGVKTDLAPTTDFTATGLNNPNGGTITLIGLSVLRGDQVVIFGETPIQRLADFQQSGDFFADTVNKEEDLQTMMMQEMQRDVNRSVKVDLGSDAPGLPLPEANKIIVGSPDGTGWINGTDISKVDEASEYAARAEAAEVRAQKIADEFEFDAFSPMLREDRDALSGIIALRTSFYGLYLSGGITTSYPAVYVRPVIPRPEEDDVFIANRNTAMRRLDQMNNFVWTPQSTLPGMLGDPPDYDYFIQGEEQTGPAYGSVDLVGEGYVGLTCSIESFVTAASNGSSIFYEDYTTFPGWVDIRRSGPVPMGAVCSTIYARAVEWPFAPTTTRVDADWRQWGFLNKVSNGRFSASSLKEGDLLNEHGGGHVEVVRNVSSTTITLMDMTFGGIDFQTYDIASGEADNYIRARNYALLIYDYRKGGVLMTYEAEPFAPLSGESLTGTINDRLQLYKGNKTSYLVGESVHFDILVGAVDELVILREGVEVERVSSGGNERITRTYTATGDYTAYLLMGDATFSDTETFKICNVQASLDTNTAPVGGDVNVTFSTDNCDAVALVVCRTSDNSTTPMLRLLNADEVSSGKCSFAADLRPDNYYVQIIANTSFRNDAVFNKPLAGLALTVGD